MTKGRGAIAFLEKGQRMNSKLYVSILDDKLTRFMIIHGCSAFQHFKTMYPVMPPKEQWPGLERWVERSYPGQGIVLTSIRSKISDSKWRWSSIKISVESCQFEERDHESVVLGNYTRGMCQIGAKSAKKNSGHLEF